MSDLREQLEKLTTIVGYPPGTFLALDRQKITVTAYSAGAERPLLNKQQIYKIIPVVTAALAEREAQVRAEATQIEMRRCMDMHLTDVNALREQHKTALAEAQKHAQSYADISAGHRERCAALQGALRWALAWQQHLNFEGTHGKHEATMFCEYCDGYIKGPYNEENAKAMPHTEGCPYASAVALLEGK